MTATKLSATKPTNPFYAALVAAGVAFAITACAYGVMTVRGLDPHVADEEGLMGLMSRHGLAIMVVELIVLGALTAAMIGTDEYWTRRESGRARLLPSRDDTTEEAGSAEPLAKGDVR